MKNENPFIYGRYLRPKYFCNRKEETKKILEAIEKQQDVILIGKNGLGKTTLLKHVLYLLNKSQEINAVYLDALKAPSLEDFLGEFIKNTISFLTNVSKKEKKKLIKKFLSKVEESNITDRFNDLVEYLSTLDKSTIIIIDNYNTLLQFPYSRFNESKKIQFLLAGTKGLADVEKYDAILIDKIKSENYRSFILKQFESTGRTISEKSIKKIFEFSSGETSLIQLICSKLWETSKTKIKSQDVEIVLDKIISESSQNFEIIKFLLSPYQWKLLLAIATEKEAIFVTSNAFIEKYKLNAPSSVKTALDSLLEKELIVRAENSYSISNSTLRYWLTK